MKSTSLPFYMDVLHAEDVDSLLLKLIEFANERDFGLTSASWILTPTSSVDPLQTARPEVEYHFISNTPQAFQEAAHDDDGGRRDPVLTRLKRLSVPFCYDKEFYVEADCADLWEHQAAHGYRSGIAVALHLRDDRHFFLGIDRDHRLPNDARIAEVMAEMQMLAAYAQQATQRLLPFVSEQARSGVRIALTQTELEVLRWTMEGSSAWTIGQILCISEHTVHVHLRNAMRKLEAPNRHQAVARAIADGLL